MVRPSVALVVLVLDGNQMLDRKTEREIIIIALNALRALLVRANDPQDATLLSLVDEVRKGYGCNT